MTGKRNRGQTGNKSRDNGYSLGATGGAVGGDVPATDDDDSPCGTCGITIGNEDSLECEICSVWTHGSQKCSGLPYNAFKTIVDFSNKGVTYVCTACRLSRSQGVNKPASGAGGKEMVQLFDTVKALAHEVSQMAKEIRELKSNGLVGGPVPTNPSVVPSSAEIRTILHEEAVEIREREKRADSVIIRGLGSDNDTVITKFNDVVSHLFNRNKVMQLEEIVPINQNLVRAKIKDPVQRKELLSVSKNLRTSQYNTVFITRDLTFKQREDLKVRLASRRVASTTQTSSENVSGTAVATGTSSSNSATQATKN